MSQLVCSNVDLDLAASGKVLFLNQSWKNLFANYPSIALLIAHDCVCVHVHGCVCALNRTKTHVFSIRLDCFLDFLMPLELWTHPRLLPPSRPKKPSPYLFKGLWLNETARIWWSCLRNCLGCVLTIRIGWILWNHPFLALILMSFSIGHQLIISIKMKLKLGFLLKLLWKFKYWNMCICIFRYCRYWLFLPSEGYCK